MTAKEILEKHVDPHCFLKNKCDDAILAAMREVAELTWETASEHQMNGVETPYDSSIPDEETFLKQLFEEK